MRSVKVGDYMATKLVTFSPRANVVEAMQVFLDRKISGAPVVDEHGELLGMLSEADVMQVVVQDSYYDESAGVVADFMRTPVDAVDPNLDIYTVAERFIKEGRRRFPVVSNGQLVGQISRRDVLRAMSDREDKKKRR